MTPAFKHYDDILALKEGDYVELLEETNNFTVIIGMRVLIPKGTIIRINGVGNHGFSGLADVDGQLEDCFIKNRDYNKVMILTQKPSIADLYEWYEGLETGDVGLGEQRDTPISQMKKTK